MRVVQATMNPESESDTERVVDSVPGKLLPLWRSDLSVYETGLDLGMAKVVLDEIDVFA